MSIKAMAWAWQQALSTSAKIVLLALADHSDDDGICWPGIKGIASKCGLTDRSVREQLNLLTHKNLLFITARQTDNGRYLSNCYKLVIDGTTFIPEPRSSLNHVQGGGGTTFRGTPEPGSSMTLNHVQGNLHVEPSLEPSREPSSLASLTKKPKSELQKHRNALKEKLVEVCGFQPATPAEWGPVEKAVSLIISANGTPADVQQRYANLQKHWPNITIKPMTLASNWGLAEHAPSRAGVSSNGNKPRKGGRAVDSVKWKEM